MSAMDRALPRPLNLDWRIPLLVGLALLAVVNGFYVVRVVELMFTGTPGVDFHILTWATEAANPYHEPAYVWSPLAVPILSALLPLGFGLWTALHFAALLLIRPWPLAGLVALSYPFWFDLSAGNVMVFVFVAALSAMQGSRAGMVVFLALALLMPRPIMLPVLAWLLWKEPWTRLPFVGLAVGQLVIVTGMGLLDDWVARLLTVGGKEQVTDANWGPTRFIPYWLWGAVFLPLAGWLTYKGRIGIASLAVSPYLFPSYLLMALLPVHRQLAVRHRPGTLRLGSTATGDLRPSRAVEGQDG